MYKLYTPSQWYSLFQTPSIYIEDDGLIYDESEYYKTFRNPIGQIDFSTNYIYGSDYLKTFRREIGKINHNGDVIEIFGEDHFKSFAQPILFIRNGEIFSEDPRYHTFPERVGYLAGGRDPFGGGGFGGDGFDNDDEILWDDPPGSTPVELGPFGKFISSLLTLLIGLAVFAGLGALTYLMLKDSEYLISVYFVLFGALIAFLFAKDPGSSIVITWVVTTVLLFVYDYKLSTADGPLSTFTLIISIILFPFATGLIYAFPSIIAGGLAYLIKYPFIKKKQSKKK